MRVCYFGTFYEQYPRNAILIHGLAQNGVEVTSCHVPLWHGTEDKVATLRSRRHWLDVATRAVRAYVTLLWQARHIGPVDALIVGYMGQLDMFPARLVARRLGVPLVLDVFMSIGLIVRQRELVRPGDGLDRLVGWVERRACQLADMIWLDTPLYVDYFVERYDLPRERFRLIPTGADDRYFYPTDPAPADERPFTVTYVGGYVPGHGVETIVRAAARLRSTGIRFEMIGEGQMKPPAQQLARELGADNVIFDGWVDKTALAKRLAGADVCLGIFGRQRQHQITVPNKIYEGLAVAKPVVTGHTPAVAATFEDGRHMLFVPLEDPEALAAAICRLRDDPALRQRLATEGHRLYRERYTPAALGAIARRHLEELLNSL
jgi:glycosyltransferase involved in cell wall biosynthesis